MAQQLVISTQEANKIEHHLTWHSILTITLITMLLVSIGIYAVHLQHGYDGAIFTVYLIAALMVINIVGYIVVAYVMNAIENYNKNTKQHKNSQYEQLLCDSDSDNDNDSIIDNENAVTLISNNSISNHKLVDRKHKKLFTVLGSKA